MHDKMSDFMKLMALECISDIIDPQPSCDKYKSHPSYKPRDYRKPIKGGKLEEPQIIEYSEGNIDFKCGNTYLF